MVPRARGAGARRDDAERAHVGAGVADGKQGRGHGQPGGDAVAEAEEDDEEEGGHELQVFAAPHLVARVKQPLLQNVDAEENDEGPVEEGGQKGDGGHGQQKGGDEGGGDDGAVDSVGDAGAQREEGGTEGGGGKGGEGGMEVGVE